MFSMETQLLDLKIVISKKCIKCSHYNDQDPNIQVYNCKGRNEWFSHLKALAEPNTIRRNSSNKTNQGREWKDS